MEKVLKQKLPDGKFSNVSPQHRKVMQGVRGRGNLTTEARLRAGFIRAGISGWHIQNKQLIGTPDFYFPKNRLAVFVDGCFWHGCSVCGHVPKKNSSFWRTKIARNKIRDKRNGLTLRKQGITVERFWEHELARSLSRCVENIKKRTKGN